MSKLYRDYFWKDAVPVGQGSLPEKTESDETAYKIVMDPYRKRIAIEMYSGGHFKDLIYDSAIFDFRHLKPEEQTAWQKVKLQETENRVECLIRNQDDRIVAREVYRFENRLCRECQAFSPHGFPISTQLMYYTSLGDAFNGVILFDQNDHPVVSKRYALDEQTSDFTELLEESWNMGNASDNHFTQYHPNL